MFTILIPVALAPLLVTLFWAENKAKRLGLVEKALGRPGADAVAAQPVESRSFIGTAWHWMETFDLIGLVFLETAVALILVPLTLSSTEAKGWHDGASRAVVQSDTPLIVLVGCSVFDRHARCRHRPSLRLRRLGSLVRQAPRRTTPLPPELHLRRRDLDVFLRLCTSLSYLGTWPDDDRTTGIDVDDND